MRRVVRCAPRRATTAARCFSAACAARGGPEQPSAAPRPAGMAPLGYRATCATSSSCSISISISAGCASHSRAACARARSAPAGWCARSSRCARAAAGGRRRTSSMVGAPMWMSSQLPSRRAARR
eukprot:scaffold4781_cov339-Prasinococcus_capsulatus_cf.AAC.26